MLKQPAMEKHPFPPTITNEAAAQLSPARFPGRMLVVDREEQIAEACAYLAAQPVLGFDTETRPSFKAGVTNRVALLQLSGGERCYLFRLCRIPLDRAILRLLERRDLPKIGADVAGDIRSLHVLRKFRPGGFIDLQQLVGEWGVEEKSLRKMAAIVLGQRVSKAQRLSNWEAARLTEQQMMYAATDAWVCPEIYRKLLRTQKTSR